MIILLNSILFTILCFLNKSSQGPLNNLNLYEGEICRNGKDSGANYACKRIENCESLREEIGKQNYPDICSFNGSHPIVCCSPTTFGRQKNHNIANEKCRQYWELVRNAGFTFRSKMTKRNTDIKRIISNYTSNFKYQFRASDSGLNTRIELEIPGNVEVMEVGGEPAVAMEFPHMAIIGFGEKLDQIQWGCGGSVISAKWILTAAHCKNLGAKNVASWVRLGDLNIASDADNARPKDYRIVEHVLHPEYKPPSLYNDIALFRLETDIEFSEFVKPICLNSDPLLNPEVLTGTGWGKTSTGGPTSDDLQKVDLIAFSAHQCNVSYFVENNPKLKFGILPDSMICAGSTEGDKDSCGGDSGGPLQIKNADYYGMYTQVGITSFGKNICGDKDAPGVYTRVSKYIPWIENIVWP